MVTHNLVRNRGLRVAAIVVFGPGCDGGKQENTCSYDVTIDSLEDYAAEMVPIYCSFKERCHKLGVVSYEECVEAYRDHNFTSQNCKWEDAWRCDAAQCVVEWEAQEDALQDSDPECADGSPDPWRPEICAQMADLLNCELEEGE